ERNVRAQQSGSIDYANWMAGLDDNLFLMRLSIPGTHDAATKGLSSVGETQTKSIAEQLACGIRMFDLRPRVKDNKLMIYHGILATDVSFDDAMSTLCTFLDKHPRECLFVIMRHEDDGASDSEKSQWPSKMYEALSARRGYIVDYSPALTVRDLRGKILVMSRNTYDNGPIGAYLEGGGDNTVYDRTIVGRNGGMAITTQDIYNAVDRLDEKKTQIGNLLSRSTSEKEHRLYFNHTSGYSKTFFGIVTAAGIKECAQQCNAAAIDYMKDKTGPMGFIMMDFAGDNSDNLRGQELIDVIIRNNEATFAKERDKEGSVIRDGKKFIVPMAADRLSTARYFRKDAKTASASAVDALTNPSASWYKNDFDDAAWETLELPMGSPGYEAPYRYTWEGEYNCYWLRCQFTLDEVCPSSAYMLQCYHDDDYQLYVNGTLLHRADGWTTPGTPVVKEIKHANLLVGKNVIAVKVQQNYGGAYFDCGIYEVEDKYDAISSPLAPAQTFDAAGPIYDLAGRRVVAPTHKGIYIRGGKKTVW
ncbi:MAG: phosphatidylinositol-specific phospholipase C domain-containing protein, partial [Bacteroidaceae bacterium]|nr:phosphatidylinositol-specific phospholipase C domain-containing protein [Bacteroidaceae bacterium]